MSGTEPAGEDRGTLAAFERVVESRDRFEAAWRAGQRPRIEDYLAEAPEPERPGLLRELLAVELELGHHCGEQPTLQEYHARFPEQRGLVDAIFGETMPRVPSRAIAGQDRTLTYLITSTDGMVRSL